ncbi:hypothetical protein [Mesorhizobium loti]|nr:hypothetical protein [Mesorhizobium loti]
MSNPQSEPTKNQQQDFLRVNARQRVRGLVAPIVMDDFFAVPTCGDQEFV